MKLNSCMQCLVLLFHVSIFVDKALCESPQKSRRFAPIELNYTESYVDDLHQCDVDVPLDAGIPQDWVKIHRFLYLKRLMFDSRMNIPVVRILGLIGRSQVDEPFNLTDPDLMYARPITACELYWNTTNQYEVVSISVDMLQEHKGYAYSGAFLLCPLSNELRYDPPSQVSLVVQTPTCYKRVVTFDVPENPLQFPYVPKYELSLCLRPFYGYLNHDDVFDNTMLLVEWIELNRMLGVSRFTFYEGFGVSVSQNVTLLLRHYEQLGLVEVVKWGMPLTPFVDVEDFAQTPLLQDCWMRHLGQSEWVTSLDTDEFLIATNNYNLKEFINGIQEGVMNQEDDYDASSWPYEPLPPHPQSILKFIDPDPTAKEFKSYLSKKSLMHLVIKSRTKSRTSNSVSKLPHASKMNKIIAAGTVKPIFNTERRFSVFYCTQQRKNNMDVAGFYDYFMFKNSFFFLEMIDGELLRGLPVPLATQAVIQSALEVQRYTERSKMLFRPAAVVMVAVHMIVKLVPGGRPYFVTEDQGKLHHYRWGEGMTGNSIKKTEVQKLWRYGKKTTNTEALKYQDDLIENVKTTLLDVFGTYDIAESKLNLLPLSRKKPKRRLQQCAIEKRSFR
eukprot:Platyproteum_vivax@DN7615_c0_g1_i3.p1